VATVVVDGIGIGDAYDVASYLAVAARKCSMAAGDGHGIVVR